MSTPPLNPTAFNEPKATRFPSTSTRVSLPNKPRRLNWTVPSPPLAMFRLTVPPASCGRKVVRSVALRMPSFSMSAGRYVSTGFGPTSSAVGMFEPVTITSTTVATLRSASRELDTVSWPSEIEARSKGIPTMLHPTHQMNGRSMTSSFR